MLSVSGKSKTFRDTRPGTSKPLTLTILSSDGLVGETIWKMLTMSVMDWLIKHKVLIKKNKIHVSVY